MQRRTLRRVQRSPLLGFSVLLAALLAGFVGRAAAADKPENECLGSFEGLPNLPQGGENGGTVTCNDCDPSCDQDGVTTPNQQCTFKLMACVNKPQDSCVASTLKKVKLMVKKGVTGTLTKPNGMDSACAAFTAVVKTKKHGTKAGKTTVKLMVKSTDKRTDKDVLTLVCNSTSTACPTTTTSSTSTSSTTSTSVACLSCCASASRFKFTTGLPQIGSGTCDTSDGLVTGTMVDDTGANLCNLRAGGLYFGGAGVGIPLPSVIPDMTTSIAKIATCNATTGAFTLAATSNIDTGSNRDCTSAGINNPEYPGKTGCLFGPPLPLPNSNSPATSTCLVNRVSTSASGSGNCDGTTSLDLPLLSDLYLTGPSDGVIPCPRCAATPGPGMTCQAGPNAGQACTPGSSGAALGAAYPTSHDCPPAPGAFIGSLPIPLALTTGTQSKTSADLSAMPFVFCGFCGQQFTPTFENPPHACTADSQCTTAPFMRCRQRTSGAFGQGPARTITETGTPAACLTDGLPHSSILASTFCTPPSYNSTVDAAGDLPGPGAITLTGQAQALP